MVCNNCGAQVNGKYCEYCGSKVSRRHRLVIPDKSTVQSTTSSANLKKAQYRLLKSLVACVCAFIVLIAAGYLLGDHTAPVLEAQKQTVRYGTSLTVHDLVTATDDRSKTVELSIEQVSPQDDSVTNNESIIRFDAPGNYLVTIQGSDENDNVATIDTAVEVIDDVSPNFLEIDNTELAYSNKITISDSNDVENTIFVRVKDDICQPRVNFSDITPISQGLSEESYTYDENQVVFNNIGEYEVELVAIDDYFNQSFKSFTVNVVDRTAPVLEGVKDEITIDEYDTNPDYLASVTAKDEIDGDLTDQISVDASKVDYGTIGEYYIYFVIVDKAGNETIKSASVIIKDSTPPALTVDKSNFTLTVGDDVPDYENTVRAIDSQDGDLSGKISFDDSNVDYDSPGTYTVTYSVTDSSGNVTEKDAQVKVTAKANTSTEAVSSSGGDGTVLITRTGECYHDHECGRGTYFPVSLEEAKAKGLRPCKKCYR